MYDFKGTLTETVYKRLIKHCVYNVSVTSFAFAVKPYKPMVKTNFANDLNWHRQTLIKPVAYG